MNIQAKTNSSKAIDYVSKLTANDVVFASAGPRSHRPYKPISINSAQNTGRFLRWALQSGKPDPAKWRDLHQKTAIAQKSGSNSAAAKSYAEIADLLVPQHRYDDLKSLRLQSINCQRRQFELSALMLRYKTWAPKVTIAGASKKLLEGRTQNPAMYWKDSTSYGDNVGRLGLWLAGVNAHEFNDITHAYGATYFGRLLLQRLILRVKTVISPRVPGAGPGLITQPCGR